MVIRELRRLFSHLLPAERRTSLLLLFYRCLYRDGVPVPFEGAAGPFRSDDHGLQSHGHVRRRSHSTSARDLSRCLLGDREFTIHKEFVSPKIAGETASLQNPALDRILDFAAEAGLVVLIHNDIDVPFSKAGFHNDPDVPFSTEGSEPAYLNQVKALFKRHPQTTIIWAHTGVGRVVRPIRNHAARLGEILGDPAFHHVYFDISWSEVAKYIVATPESTRITADLINRYPDRFLFGTDEVAPPDQPTYLRVYYQYEPLWNMLDKKASELVRKGNYERLFNEARQNVRAWEGTHVK